MKIEQAQGLKVLLSHDTISWGKTKTSAALTNSICIYT